jgi:hypothetical protein
VNLRQIQKNAKFWLVTVTDTEDLVSYYNWFFASLCGEKESVNTPWGKYETRDDWTQDELISRLEEMGASITSAGGRAPVQVEGTLGNGVNFYFRARGNHWRCEDEDTDFLIDGKYGNGRYAASHMPYSVVFSKIKQFQEAVEAQ